MSSLLDVAERWKRWACLCSVLMLVETGLGLALPWLAGKLTAGVLAGSAADHAQVMTQVVGILALQAILRFIVQWQSTALAQRILAALRIHVYDHLQSLPMAYHYQRRRGEMLALVTHDVERLVDFTAGTLLNVIPALVAVAGSLGLMFKLDARISLLVMVLVPVFFLLLKIVGRRLRPLAMEVQKMQSDVVAIAQENLHLLPAIKANVRESIESRRFRAAVNDLLRVQLQETRLQSALSPMAQWCAALGMLVALWLLGRTELGEMNAAHAISFLLYAALLTRPLTSLADVYGQTRQAGGALHRLQCVLAEPTEEVREHHPRSEEILPLSGEILFRNVEFSYPGCCPVFSDFNLHIRAGEIVALVGPNGSGKTTFIHLLLRILPLDAGVISIDGHDISQISLHRLRSQIGLVSQTSWLSNASVRDNIAWGYPQANMEMIREAARKACADEFIELLPHGYDTIIGDEGVKLSGGQRQRLGLARALIKDVPVLLLDEPTAMLDATSVAGWRESFRSICRGRTVVMVTHNPEDARLVDRVIEIGSGLSTHD